MTNRDVKSKIRQSMEHSLSGLSADPFLLRRVLARAQETKGEEKVVKKLSGALILAIVLALLLATAALALTNWEALRDYFETVRVLDQTGALARWSDEDRLKLLSAMAEAGIVSNQDARVQTALDESLTLEERGAAADVIIAERYGEDYFTAYTVEQLELAQGERTQDEKAAYEAWSEDYWVEFRKRETPPMTEARAYYDTMGHLTEIGDFPKELIRDVEVSFEWDEREKCYLITASIDKDAYMAAKRRPDQESVFDTTGTIEGDAFRFQFWMGEHGTFLGFYEAHAPENRAELSLEEGRVIAETALRAQLGVDQSALADLTLEANYAEGHEYIQEEGRFRAVCSYIWRDQESGVRYIADVDAKTGRLIHAHDWREWEAMREKESAWMAEIVARLEGAGVNATLVDEQEAYFWDWSMERKAAWSQAARPIVHGYLAEHAEFVAYLEDMVSGKYAGQNWHNLISLTQFAYGVPDEKAISQEEAFAIAREAALKQGAKRNYIDDNKLHALYYDVTDPARPVWKVHISTIFGASDTEHPYDPTAAWGYFVVIDAHSAEVQRVEPRTVNTRIRDMV